MLFKKSKDYNSATIQELIGNVVQTALLHAAGLMAGSGEKRMQICREKFLPYLTPHNIGLLVNDTNIAWLRNKIAEGLTKLTTHYLVHLEPTADNKDLAWSLACRPGGGTDDKVEPVKNGYLSQLTAEDINSFISKFLPNGSTAE